MNRPLPTPAAMQSLAANRAADQRNREKLELLDAIHASAKRIVELTDLVGDLADRVTVLEAR